MEQSYLSPENYKITIINYFNHGIRVVSLQWDIEELICKIILYLKHITCGYYNWMSTMLGVAYAKHKYKDVRALVILNNRYLDVISIIDKHISDESTEI